MNENSAKASQGRLGLFKVHHPALLVKDNTPMKGVLWKNKSDETAAQELTVSCSADRPTL